MSQRPKGSSTSFDEAAADRAARFFPELLVHVKGRLAGRPFRLLPWMEHDLIRPLFGRVRPDGQRMIRQAWVEVGKKNSKSTLGSGIGLKLLFADGEYGAEVYSVANSKGQAGIVFNVAADMVEASPILSKRAKVYRSRIAHHGVIYVPKTESVYRVLSADVALNDGINASGVIFDEPHRAVSRELFDLMEESGIARSQPMLVAITTAGVDDPSLLGKQKHDYAVKVRDGIIDDPTFLPVLFYNSPDADWRDPETWRRANPSMGSDDDVASGDAIFSEADMAAKLPELEESPAKLATFKRLRCGMWLPPSAFSSDRLFEIAAWDRSAGIVNIDDGATIGAAVDMASTTDMTAAVAVHWNEPGECRNCRQTDKPCVDVVAKFWMPAEAIAGSKQWSKGMKAQLRTWADEGWLTVVDGAVIDDSYVKAGIGEWADQYDLSVIAVDPWQARQLRIDLEDAGFVVFEHRQTMQHMSPPTKQLIDLVVDGRFHHGGNPILRWMADNAIGKTDSDENIRPDRRKSSGKIDGIVAAVMAITASTIDEEPVDALSQIW